MNKMINNVDGVLLARDDFENHYKLSSSFKERYPVYIENLCPIIFMMQKK